MLNFLPQKNRKYILYEYKLRYFSFLLFFVLIVFVFAFCFLLPSYFFAKYKEESVSDRLNSFKEIYKDEGKKLSMIVKDVNDTIGVLLPDNSLNMLKSEIVNTVISKREKGILLSSFSFVNEDNKYINLVISGISNSREDIINFNKELNKIGIFEEINLPISNIIKDKKSDFTMVLKYIKK